MATKPQQNPEPQQLKVGLWGTVPRRLLFLFKIILGVGAEQEDGWASVSTHRPARRAIWRDSLHPLLPPGNLSETTTGGQCQDVGQHHGDCEKLTAQMSPAWMARTARDVLM